MSRFVKTLVVLQFFLAIGALALATMLYQKRELLLGRTLKLERSIISVAATLEQESMQVAGPVLGPERDISPVRADLPTDVDRTRFWPTYRTELEQFGRATLNLAKHRWQLANFYQRDPDTGELVRDPHTGLKLMEGPGTMQEILDRVARRAAQQYEQLNDTREQLQRTRAELVATIEDTNTQRHGRRQALCTIVDRDRSIGELEQTVAGKNQEISLLTETQLALEQTIEQRNNDILAYSDEIKRLTNDVVWLKGEVERLLVHQRPRNREMKFTTGRKGVVTAADNEYNFVVIDLDETFKQQYREHKQKGGNDVLPDMMIVRRTRKEQRFISKVRVTTMDTEKGLAVADVVPGWRLDTILPGDETVLF